MRALFTCFLVLIALQSASFSPLWSKKGVLEGKMKDNVDGDTVLLADPPIPRPSSSEGKSCDVPLFNEEYYTYANTPFSFIIPEECRGSWSKVVLNIEISCSAGRQFDRTMSIYFNTKEGTPLRIYSGTTPEPRENLAPSVSVELDITQYSSLLMDIAANGTGLANLGTVVNDKYNGVPQASGSLSLYLSPSPPPPFLAPSYISPIGSTNVQNSSDILSVGVVFPEKIGGVWLEVIAQGQSQDEFWWSCNPSGAQGECINSAFRVLIIRVDGEVAILYPLYPYLFTGGVDPYLWQPIPGVQTNNLQPLRIDISGFITTGKNVQIDISVGGMDSDTGINSFWSLSANLLYFVGDYEKYVGSGKTTFTTNNGDGLYPTIIESTIGSTYFVTTTYEATWSRDTQMLKENGDSFTDTTKYRLKFSNTQAYQNNGTKQDQSGFSYSVVNQEYELDVKSSGGSPWSNSYSLIQTLSTTNNYTAAKTNLTTLTFTNDVTFELGWNYKSISPSLYSANIQNVVKSEDHSITVKSKGKPDSSSNTAESSQTYFFLDSSGNIYDRAVYSKDNLPVTNVTQALSMDWWADPYWGRREAA